MYKRLITFIMLPALLVACSPFRIIDYSTYDPNKHKSAKPAVLYVMERYRITKFDDKEVDFTPVLVGAFGGRHIYMLPGKHSIQFGWGALHQGPSDKDTRLSFKATENAYYELTTDMQGNFIIEQKMRPEKIPDSSWNYHDKVKQ